MCKQWIYHVRLNNRGGGVLETVANQRYQLNLPNEILMDRPCLVTVSEGTIQLLTDNTVFHTYSEAGITCNIPQRGVSTEAPAGAYQPDNVLFTVNLTGYHTNNILEPFRQDGTRTFFCGSLPNFIQFERYLILAAGKVPTAVEDYYISALLAIEYLSDEELGRQKIPNQNPN